jgi:hypothetical protein
MLVGRRMLLLAGAGAVENIVALIDAGKEFGTRR